MSYMRTGVTLKASLLGTNPVVLPKTKNAEGVSKTYSSWRVGCPLTKDWSNPYDRTVNYEPRRVAQDVNVEGISENLL